MRICTALVLCAAGLISVSTADVQWYRTAQGNSDRLTKQSDLQFGADFSYDQVVMINRSRTYQTIIGFGGAFTDSSAYVFSELNTTMQAKVLSMYFSDEGLRYNMARLPIGSCDFSLMNYDYDNTTDDANLTKFSIDHDKDRIIPFIQRANATILKWSGAELFIVASPWSPPKWIKENRSPYCPLGCLGCTVRDVYKDSWALYFSKFISSYRAEGIDIWGVTIQNEPEHCPLEFEGMHFTPETQKDFLKAHLGPRLNKDHPNVKILIYDHNKDHVVKWSQTLYSDPEAAKYAWGTAVHWYSGDQFENVLQAHNLFPDKPILATEATEVREKDPANPVWKKGEKYAHDIIGDLNNWVVGWIDWNLVLDLLGGPDHAGPSECEGIIKCGSDGMLLVDTDNQVIYPQVFYYYMGHISKFIPRGSVRVMSSVQNSSLESLAVLTPSGEVVVVIMNTGDEQVSFKLLDISSTGSKQAVKIAALPHSIQTFMYL